jgi:hypothetical protein
MDDYTDKHSVKGLRTDAQRIADNIHVGGVKKLLSSFGEDADAIVIASIFNRVAMEKTISPTISPSPERKRR